MLLSRHLVHHKNRQTKWDGVTEARVQKLQTYSVQGARTLRICVRGQRAKAHGIVAAVRERPGAAGGARPEVWNYTPEQAIERMQWEDYYIVECYINKTPVSDCAVEVGYGC